MADAADIEAFVAVARVASFTRAAQAIGSSKSNVGKAVQRLEARLGTRLFQRTTRSVRLTEDGETYFRAAAAPSTAFATPNRRCPRGVRSRVERCA